MGEKSTGPHNIQPLLTSADKGHDDNNDYVRKRMVKVLMKRMVNEGLMARRVMMVNA